MTDKSSDIADIGFGMDNEKQATLQTMKDRKLVAMRVEKNKKYFNKVEQALGVLLNGKTRKSDLLAYAKKIIAQNGLKLERLMKRSKPVIICWFCEHMNLDPLLTQLIQKQEMVEKYGPAEVFNANISIDKNNFDGFSNVGVGHSQAQKSPEQQPVSQPVVNDNEKDTGSVYLQPFEECCDVMSFFDDENEELQYAIEEE